MRESRFRLDIEKNFLTCESGEALQLVSREVVDASALDMFKAKFHEALRILMVH